MVQVRVPEFQTSLDPDKISRIDISTSEDEQTHVDVFFEGEKQAPRLVFSDQATALRYYTTVWQLRTTIDATVYLLPRAATSSPPHEVRSTATASDAPRA